MHNNSGFIIQVIRFKERQRGYSRVYFWSRRDQSHDYCNDCFVFIQNYFHSLVHIVCKKHTIDFWRICKQRRREKWKNKLLLQWLGYFKITICFAQRNVNEDLSWLRSPGLSEDRCKPVLKITTTRSWPRTDFLQHHSINVQLKHIPITDQSETSFNIWTPIYLIWSQSE